MAEDFGGLLAGAGVGLGVGAANQVTIDTHFGQKNPGSTSWIVGGLGALLGGVGHFALPQRSRGWRKASDDLLAASFAVLGQVAAYDADRALDRVAKVSGSLSITTASSSGGSASATSSTGSASATSAGATSAGSAGSALLALDSSDLNFGAQ